MLTSILSKILLPRSRMGNIRLGEEQRASIQFANYLRQLSLEQNFPYVWFHIPNEYARHKVVMGDKVSWKNSSSFGVRQSHMGRIPGTPDFCFVGKHKSFFIEFKSGKGKQTEEQKIFEEWCNGCGVKYYISRSFQDAKSIIDIQLLTEIDVRNFINSAHLSNIKDGMMGGPLHTDKFYIREDGLGMEINGTD